MGINLNELNRIIEIEVKEKSISKTLIKQIVENIKDKKEIQ